MTGISNVSKSFRDQHNRNMRKMEESGSNNVERTPVFWQRRQQQQQQRLEEEKREKEFRKQNEDVLRSLMPVEKLPAVVDRLLQSFIGHARSAREDDDAAFGAAIRECLGDDQKPSEFEHLLIGHHGGFGFPSGPQLSYCEEVLDVGVLMRCARNGGELNVPLPANLEERTKLGVAPEHFDGVAVLSAELASYIASQATPPLLAGDGPAALGVWLAPFDIDRRPLAALRGCV